jgi:hypothetical protein|tara:strand:+ start:309 stop:494 length:186 start_codon:yes stop_codon:yes gene_type:complete
MKLTSVKILPELHKDFRIKSLREEFTLQKLVNRSIHLFLNDEKYQANLISYNILEVSGSGL